jgi:hypothetical protein
MACPRKVLNLSTPETVIIDLCINNVIIGVAGTEHLCPD